MVCSGYSAVGKMDDCYSEGRGFATLSGTFPFADIKISSTISCLAFESNSCDASLCMFLFVCLGHEKL